MVTGAFTRLIQQIGIIFFGNFHEVAQGTHFEGSVVAAAENTAS